MVKKKFLFSLLTTTFLLSSIVSAESSEEILKSSPIEKVYTMNETALFLHEDTSISGFGSNIAGSLGQINEEGNNTGEMIRVSGPTGFSELVPGRERVFGLKPVHEKETKKVFLFDVNIGDAARRYETNFEVRDISLVGNHLGNPHQATAYIDEQGFVKTRGSDYYRYLGIGNERPHNAYPGGSAFVIDKEGTTNWYKVLAPDGENILYPETGIGYFLSNEDNSGNETELISAPFDITRDQFTIEIKLREFAPHPTEPRLTTEHDTVLGQVMEVYDGTLTDAEILSGAFTPIAQFSRPNNYAYAQTIHRVIDLTNVTTNTFKIKHKTSYVKWDLRVRDRIFLENAVKVSYRNTRGHHAIVDASNNVYINTASPLIKKVNFPIDVEVVPETLNNDGDDSQFSIIDTLGRVWTFSGTTPSLKDNFPTIDSLPFYDTHKITKVSVGNGFVMAISEHRTSGVTNVWTWGSNAHGKLGVEEIAVGGSTSTPILVSRQGIPLANIQDVAAGQHFSIIVQNTEAGQLVWSSGRNNKGQLGGGIMLQAEIPQLIPGLKDIDRVSSRVNHTYALNDTTKTMYRFGETESYVSEYSFSSILGHPQYLFPSYYPYWHFIGENGMARNKDTSYDVGGIGGSYGTIKPWYGDVYDSTGTNLNIDFRATFNAGNDFFQNPKSLITGIRQSQLVDANGRLWGIGATHYTSSYRGTGRWYNINGTELNHNGVSNDEPSVPGRNYAWPAKFDQTTYAEPIFEFITGGTEVTNSIIPTYAVDVNGKVWYTPSYFISRLDSTWEINAVNIVEGFNGIYRHAFLLDHNGEIWGYGYGENGRKGDGSTISTRLPKKIDKSYFNNEKVIHAAAGIDHSLFVTETGDVYATGNNNYGKLGFGEIGLDYNRPQKVEGISNIVTVHAGEYFSLAIDDQGRVWGWGYIAGGSLGNNFPISRAFLSTAAGNDLLGMTTENEVKNVYLSTNGNQEFKMHGKIWEPEQEATNVSVDILGVAKTFEITADSWMLDVYDETVPQNWELTWNASEFNNGDVQSLTTINAEDDRGGLIQQFFSGKITVDNELPAIPTWGDTCITDGNGNETTCYIDEHFSHQSGNPVDSPIRYYMNVVQKTGENKAPVKVQYQFRKYHPYGYINDWSEWITVETKNENGYYHDFFQGFLGEHQIQMRAIDEAGNVSIKNNDTRYTQISNAGAEVEKIEIEPIFSQEFGISNSLTITGTTPDNSSIVSYLIQRKKVGEENAEWVDLTGGRLPWESADFTMKYVDEDETLIGNATYAYRVDLENSIAIGAPKMQDILTTPYAPANFSRVPTEEGLRIGIKQNEMNEGSTLYRLVLVESDTGEIYSVDRTPASRTEDILLDILDADVPFSILNNKLDISLIMRGANGKFVTIEYDKGYVNSPALSKDVTPPQVTLNLGQYKEMLSTDDLLIDISIFASDNFTAPENIDIQISKDGNSWYGLSGTGNWIQNHWSDYQTTYSKFDVSGLSGRHMIYVRAKDEAGNEGYANQEIFIARPAERDETLPVTDSDGTTPNEYNQIPVNSNYIELTVPQSGDVTEVQFSFDGVNWSGWEKINPVNPRKITLSPGEGYKSIYTRYRNEDESITDLTENDSIQYVLDYSPPTIKYRTSNGTRITTQDIIGIMTTVSDDFSRNIQVELDSASYDILTMENGVAVTHADKTVDLIKGETQNIFLAGLQSGFNSIPLIIRDEAGNITNETVVVFRK